MGRFIAGQTRQFKVEIDGYDLIGIAEVKLPGVKFLSQKLEGAGIIGEIELPNFGMTESLEVEITFNSVTDSAFRLVDFSGQLIEFKSEIIGLNATTHGQESHGLRIAMRGSCKEFDLGSLKLNEQMKVPFKLEATYLEAWDNGQQLWKFDKLNGIAYAAGKALIKKLADLF